jgi:hypothetical protein
MLMRALSVHIAHEIAGAARTRSSLRPLCFEGANDMHHFGRIAPREREGVFFRHCERSEAIHLAARRKNGLLRFARNDERWVHRRKGPPNAASFYQCSISQPPKTLYGAARFALGEW